MIPGGKIYLGIPKGFNKVGPIDFDEQNVTIRFHENAFKWDNLNIAVWYLIKNNVMFVRTYCPRINASYVDIFQNYTVPPTGAINVATFYEEID